MRTRAHTFLLSAALTVGTIGAGLAADLPVKAPPVVAPPPPIVYSWAGFYLGLNVGYGFGDIDSRGRPLPAPAPPPFTAGLSPEGILGGIQLGYNWQSGRFVYGLETDFQGADLSETVTVAPLPGFPLSNARIRSKLDYFGTFRGRLGVTATPELLLYATGGFAYGHVKNHSRSTYVPVPQATFVGEADSLDVGWTVGGGLEYGFNNWSARLEYLYVDLDRGPRYAAFAVGNPLARVRNTPGNFTFSVVRVGINYRFSPWW